VNYVFDQAILKLYTQNADDGGKAENQKEHDLVSLHRRIAHDGG
jgi:NAD-dependent SIR2 family protein deacetylase